MYIIVMVNACIWHYLEVTDVVLLNELNTALSNAKQSTKQSRAVPTNFVDLSLGSATSNSAEYTKNISWGSASSVTTSILKFEAQHTTLRVKVSNLEKVGLFSSDDISFTYYYYSEIQDRWYSEYYDSIDCNGSQGFGFLGFFSQYRYGQFQICDDGNLNSFKFHVWTTYA